MPTFTPVDFDPFADEAAPTPRLTPVDFDPFVVDGIPVEPGTDIPRDPAQRIVGRIYTDLNGNPRRWTGESFEFGEQARETTLGETAQGVALDVAQGFVRVPQAITDLGSAVLPGQLDTDIYDEATQAFERAKPEAYRAEQQHGGVVERTSEGENVGLRAPTGEAVLGTLAGSLVQAPLLVGGGGAARTVLGRVLPDTAATAVGYGGANAAMVAPGQARQTYEEAIAAGMSEEEAREAGREAGLLTAGISATTGAAGGVLATMGGQAARTALGATARGFAAEAPFETVEEVGQSIAGDVALGNEIDIDDAAEAGVLAGIAGGAPGAGIALAERASPQDTYTRLARTYGARVTSRTRSPKDNVRVGGVPNSQHLRGTAADFVVPERNKARFIADAKGRGFEAIDEGDHIHLELPDTPRDELGQREAAREAQVRAGTKARGEANAENALDRARARRRLTLDPNPDKPAPAAPAPAEDVSERDRSLYEIYDRARADMQDMARPPAERRAAKSRAQQTMQKIEQVGAVRPDGGVSQRARDMLDDAARQTQATLATPSPQKAPQAAPPVIPPAAPPVVQPPAAPVAPPPQQVRPVDHAPQEAVPEEAPWPPTDPGPAPRVATPTRQSLHQDAAQIAEVKATPLSDALNKLVVGANAPFAPEFKRKNAVLAEVRLVPKQQQQIDKLGRVLGRKIVLLDTVDKNTGAPVQTTIDGFAFDERHIVVMPRQLEKFNHHPVAVVGHEFLHTLRKQKNPLAEALIQHAKAQVNYDSSTVSRRMGDYQFLFDSMPPERAHDKFSEELVADMVGDMVNSREFWEELAASDKSLFRRTLDSLVTFLEGIMRRAKKMSADDVFDDIKALRDQAKVMLSEHIKAERRASGGGMKLTGKGPKTAPKVARKPQSRQSAAPKLAELRRTNIDYMRRVETPEQAADLNLTMAEVQAAVAGNPAGKRTLNDVLHDSFIGPLIDYGSDRFKRVQRVLQDEYLDLKEIQQQIADHYFGGRLPDNMNAYRAENLRHGAYKDARERAEDRFIVPIGRILSGADASLDEFSDYLWWRHAQERDEYLRSHLKHADDVEPDALAGIDPAQARANIATLDPKKLAAFKRAAKFVDGMRAYTNKTLLESGQITQEHYDGITSQYRYYVPLRGLPPGKDGTLALSGKKGLGMQTKPLGMRAVGRKSKPSSILEEMMRDMDNALIGVQKHRVLSSLVRLIAAHPDPNLWSIDPVHAERKWVNGVLTTVQTKGDVKDALTFMHHGIPVRLEIRDPALRKALLNLNEDNFVGALRGLGRITRWLSAAKTAWSPYFLLVNPVRDVLFASAGVAAEHDAKTLADVAKFYPYTLAVLSRDHKGGKLSQQASQTRRKMQGYAREFAAAGGKTGYTYVADIREQQRKLSSLMVRHAKSKGVADLMAGNYGTKDAVLLVRKFGANLSHTVEVANDMAENSTRLAVYAAMRERGMSVEEAASYAKEVTVNFNRKGSWSRNINAAYMFFNAAVQGGTRMAKLMANRKFAGTMFSVMAMNYTLSLAQFLVHGDDDDGESKYEKAFSDGLARRSIGFYVGEGKSVTVPMPYGPNIFSYMGHRLARMTYDLMRGKEVGPVTGDILGQVATSMSPIDPGKGWTALTPEFARVFLHAVMNKNDFDGVISPGLIGVDDPLPNFLKTDEQTGYFYRVMAAAFNDATGGDAYTEGMVNPTGEQVRYVTEQFTGGLGRLGSESYELIDNWMAGIDPEPSDVPLANVYFRGKGERRHAGSFYDNKDAYDKVVGEWKQAVVYRDRTKLEAILERAPWVVGAELSASTKEGKAAQSGSLMEFERKIDRDIGELRRAKDAILADPKLDRKTKKQRAYAVDQAIAELQQDFNAAYNRANGSRRR